MATWKRVLTTNDDSAYKNSNTTISDLGGGSGGTFLRKDGQFATPTDTNTQLSTASVRSKISATGNSQYNSSTGVITSTNTQRAITSTPSTSTSTSISASWANSHSNAIGSGAHVPSTAGSSGGEFLRQDGAWAEPAYIANTNTNQLTTFKIQASGTIGTDTISHNETIIYTAGTGMSVTRSGSNVTFTNNVTNSNTTTTTDVKSALGASLGSWTIGDSNDTTTFAGNLVVSGTTTSVNSNTVNIGDNIITLNSDESGTPSQDGGIKIERGTSQDAVLYWDESTDQWRCNRGAPADALGTFVHSLATTNLLTDNTTPTQDYSGVGAFAVKSNGELWVRTG